MEWPVMSLSWHQAAMGKYAGGAPAVLGHLHIARLP